ncbi:hypothetical protein NX059_005012 [Plenodomus lindquistii]|nr:hypothetical protein NX059_005012 [Plenodomus lindquistii]
MSLPTNTLTPDPNNPSSLKPRYEIRQLCPEHNPWAALYPTNLSTRLHDAFEASEYLVAHQINSGLSFGVFDTEYVYKTAEARACDGKLHWDRNEPSTEGSQKYAA